MSTPKDKAVDAQGHVGFTDLRSAASTDTGGSAHTPGPWDLEASMPEVGGWEVAPIDATGVCDWNREVASVISTIEDARLIAAAPDLYAALALYVHHFGDPLKVARAALAKAEGR